MLKARSFTMERFLLLLKKKQKYKYKIMYAVNSLPFNLFKLLSTGLRGEEVKLHSAFPVHTQQGWALSS